MCTYFPVRMEERDGQHMGVVENALEKCVPPFSMMCRVLFMACIEPERKQCQKEKGRGVVWRDRRVREDSKAKD